MFRSIVKAAVLAIAVQCAHAQTSPPLTVQSLDPAGISQCGGITFEWTGGLSPYSLYFMRNDTGGPVIKVFPFQLGHSMAWTVDLPGGTTFVCQVVSAIDQNGNEQSAYTGPYTILDSSDSSCINTAIFDDGSQTTTSSPIGPTSFTMIPSPTFSSSIKLTNVIVGSVLGGLAFLLLIALGLLFLFRRKSKAAEPQMMAERKAQDLEVCHDSDIRENPASK
jgi:hypothetical protein